MLLKNYYRVDTNKEAWRSLVEDFLVSVFLWSGSGLLTSIIKGYIAHIFIKAGYPLLLGKRFRVRHPSNIRIGHHVSIKDDVTLLADSSMNIGSNVIIAEKSTLVSYGPGLLIGNNVVIGKNCYIAQNGGQIKIGNNVLIADGVKMYSLNHKYNSRKLPIIQQGAVNCTIEIKDNVWIGAGVVIFNNTKIGSGSVIGANSVVRKDVPAYTVFAGNPGKNIKKII